MNVAVVLLTEPVGPVSIVVFGAVVSMVKVRDAGVWSVLVAASVARTRNVYVPCVVVLRVRGVVHDW